MALLMTGAAAGGLVLALPSVTQTSTAASGPVVVDAPVSARAGDVIGLTGAGFTPATTVRLEARGTTPAATLPVVNRLGSRWLAVRLPAAATGAIAVTVVDGGAASATVVLNRARPDHLDALQIAPGAPFRVLGRNLRLPGSTPTVTIDGLAATVDTAASDEHALVVTAPAGLAATSAARIVVDNGNGSGRAALDRAVAVVRTGATDTFGTGIGWTTAFAPLAARVVPAATDPRLATRVRCDGTQDDGPALQAAVDLAASSGGGAVVLPAGTCRLATSVQLRSRVGIVGAGRTATVLRYERDYPVWGKGLDLVALRGLTVRNAGPATEGPTLTGSTRVAVQDVRFETGASHQLFFTDNRDVAFVDDEIVQGSGLAEQGPIVLNGCSGLAFTGNHVTFSSGATSLQGVHDAWIHGNRFTRDARTQQAPGVVHQLVLDFTFRIAVTGNTFEVANGPITNRTRNDGETLLTEGGGAERTENLGTVASAGASTLRDPATDLDVTPWGGTAIPENYGVAIVGGTGLGQTRRVTGYADHTLTVDRPWDVVPDATSKYATFAWGLERAVLADNTLAGNPRGIWLYQTAVRDVEVTGNTMTSGGGIYLRSYQNLATHTFTPIYGVLVRGNRVRGGDGAWPAYVNAVMVNGDARAFGTGLLGVRVQGNEVTASSPAVDLPTEEYAGTEGFTAMMRVEDYSRYESSPDPRVLGTVLQGNTCTRCAYGLRVGTGVGGTVDAGTTTTGTPLSDVPVTSLTRETSVATVVTP